jgi:hypothetical protein
MNATMITTRDLAFHTNHSNATHRFPAGTKVHVVTYTNKPGFTLRVRGTLMVRIIRTGDVSTYAV